MSQSIPTYDLPDAKVLSCLFTPEQEALIRAQGPRCILNIAGKPHLLQQSHFERAESFSAEKLHGGGVLLLAHAAASPRLVARGYGKPWDDAVSVVLELLHDTYRGRQRVEDQASVNRRLEVAQHEEADRLVSDILGRTQGAALRGFFTTVSADRASQSGKLNALYELSNKAAVPALRQALLGAGVTEESLGRLGTLAAALHQARIAQARLDAAGEKDVARLRALKALVLGEITKVSAVAKAELPDGEWEAFQVGRLLDLPRPSGRAEPQPPTPTPTPPAPAFAAPTSPGAPTGPPAPAAAPAFTPGTILPIATPDGAPLSAVVRADGTLALLAGTAPAAAPRRKGRRQRRGT